MCLCEKPRRKIRHTKLISNGKWSVCISVDLDPSSNVISLSFCYAVVGMCVCVCFSLALSTLCAETFEAYEFLLSGDSVINIWNGCTEWWVWMCFFYLSPLMMVWRWWWFISTSQMCCLFAHKKKRKQKIVRWFAVGIARLVFGAE